ncbi:MAG: glycosyltransferase [Pseudomonadota bacterium]
MQLLNDFSLTVSAFQKQPELSATEIETVTETLRHTADGPFTGTLSGPQACVLYGLKSWRAPQAEANLGALLDGLSRASGDDCLNAAFAMKSAVAKDIHAIAHGATVVPPFTDDDYFAAIARWLGCPFVGGTALAMALRGVNSAEMELTDGGLILRYNARGESCVAIAPTSDWLPGLATLLCKKPSARTRLTVAPPHAILGASPCQGATVTQGRINPLHTVPKDEVADYVVSGVQIAALLAALLSLVGLFVVAPTVSLISVVITVTAVLLAYSTSRFLALILAKTRAPQRQKLRTAELPIYTILIPLYREDEGVGDLVRALRRLDYPHDKLDIQFLVEADDPGTRDAVVRETGELYCRVLMIPPGTPRTKPRALNAGLRQARGTLLTIFDAEDRPDPHQLRIAAETFEAAEPDLGAVQARLAIDHVCDNWLTKMFAIEYACQFDWLLPMVTGHGHIVLLGGTSNHFRTDALVEIGGWDPFNVTEDADLAIRLRRRGYKLAMIDSDTSEEAPVTVDAWVKQRSRWFKGYLQTWLVHNRRPIHLFREIGLVDGFLVHLFILGAFAAAIAHNVFVVSLLLALVGLLPLYGGQMAWLVGLQLLLAAFSYGVNFWLGVKSVKRRGNRGISPWCVAWFPLYWILMGWAAVLALYDIVRRPHHWRKTAHGVAKRPQRAMRTRGASA